ncbi:hypothetical protein U8527_04265 [Kordia algicida OT-1]|uniref:Lipoprotein n=1 Tax=Kordia algicida OT-1 TaxID=391587 RepID=A9DPW1_9FLAO|nr:hypothetical protein [Kordia algicida]EDP97536.1 hypothetical protein KAOT1_20277 [Kordia algicida OT-1]
MKKILTLLPVIVLFISCANYGEKKVFNGTEVYYKDGVTEAQADKLGESLVDSGFADGNPKSVQFTKDGDVYVFKMVIKKEFLENEAMQSVFNFFPKELSDYMDLPVDLHLCDASFNTLQVHKLADARKTIKAKATEIRYTSNVTLQDAKKLKDFLIEYGFSTDEKEKTVELDKKGGTYIFKMVIDKSKVDDKATVSLLTFFKGQLSKTAFNNQPVKVHMCDELMNTIKEI